MITALAGDPDVRIAAFEASSDGLLALTADRAADGSLVDAVVQAVNRRAAEYIGHPVERMIHGRLLSLIPSFRANGAWERCRKVIESQEPDRFRMQCAFGGLDTWFHVTATPLGQGLLLNFRDISYVQYAVFEADVLRLEADEAMQALTGELMAHQLLEDELRHAAVTDALTGALNRRGFDEALRQTSAFAKRYGHPLSVIAIDLDHFKTVNDRHGHAAGDRALKAVASLIMQELRGETDFLGRIGGEEFIVLCPHTPAEGAVALAERIRCRLASTSISVGTTAVSLTASFGVRQLADDKDVDGMLAASDDALYRAKRSGRNRIVLSP